MSLHVRLLPLAAAVVLTGCAANGWKGAEAEKSYDDALAARRLAAELNNDDYYEIHKDGRIYVLSDGKDYQSFVTTNEIPLSVTKIGAGPKGETLKMALVKKEAKAMEKIVGFKGAAQKMYEGDMPGSDLSFYGEVHDADTIYVFGDWPSLASYRRTGAASGTTQEHAGPAGETVVFVNANDDTQQKFAALNLKK